jgi:nitrate/nitrite transporter NarK
MRTFWAASCGFFSTFFSCYAPSAVGSYIKRPAPEGLDITPEELVLAGNLAVTGCILMRLIAGVMCDRMGARKTFSIFLFFGIPGMILMMCATSPGHFIGARLLIGLSLATFVPCQVWVTQFFDKKVVGGATATAAGWGNSGAGFTLLILSQLMLFLRDSTGDINLSWRICFILPLVMHVLSIIFIMTCRDLPDGSYKDLETSGAKQKPKGKYGYDTAILGFTNVNAWIMCLTYGLCFGIELTMNNRLTDYFENYFGLPNEQAGPLGAIFALMNIFARTWGGLLSDWCAIRWGLRGRLWAMWIVQASEGVMCCLTGLVTINYDGPHMPKYNPLKNGLPTSVGKIVNGTWDAPDWVGYSTTFTFANRKIAPCDSDLVKSPSHGWVGDVWTPMPIPVNTFITVRDPGMNCIHSNKDQLLGPLLACCIIFSIFVQMGCGLHYAVVPYISRPALGIVSGIIGAGGNVGAVYSGLAIIPAKTRYDEGFIRLGWIVILTSFSMFFLYFPEEGGMVLPKGLPYDPQLVKPKAGAKGSDELDFNAPKEETNKAVTVVTIEGVPTSTRTASTA